MIGGGDESGPGRAVVADEREREARASLAVGIGGGGGRIGGWKKWCGPGYGAAQHPRPQGARIPLGVGK